MADDAPPHHAGTGRAADTWRCMIADDLAAVAAIERDSHDPLPPEGEAVFADRLAAFPDGCFVVGPGRAVEGYAIAHPWRLGTVPALGLDRLILPTGPDCLWLHDVALRRSFRGRGLVTALIAMLDGRARARALAALALTAVHGTQTLWTRHGFVVVPGNEAALAAYGETALVMTRRLR
ncbi:GNAT family N-acetyltransferase [Elioraea sp.]|uniref:GNAT family N-acetyltransferase n=1 Tax=Elioraea sp. TaxID=2185103 RepID=UPI003F6EE32F